MARFAPLIFVFRLHGMRFQILDFLQYFGLWQRQKLVLVWPVGLAVKP
jgi:hypothetical protein